VFARAFAEDPIVLWPLSASGDVGGRIEQVFAMIYEGITDAGMIWEAGEADGFAVWIPPGTSQNMFDSDAAARARLAPLTDDGGARYEVLWSWIESHVPDDAWYLDAIGVDPARQGRGIGGALIRLGLDRAAQDGVPAFLETAVEDNVGYYEGFGFRVIDEGAPAPDGPRVWFMQTVV
jgi:ribosomal protein S18 acetylase RimI-like enzyme